MPAAQMTSDQQQPVPSGLSVGIIPMSGSQARRGTPWTYTTGINALDPDTERLAWILSLVNTGMRCGIQRLGEIDSSQPDGGPP